MDEPQSFAENFGDQAAPQSFAENFGYQAAQARLTLEETETLFDCILESGRALRDEGCNCKMELLVDLKTRLFRFEHYDGCALEGA